MSEHILHLDETRLDPEFIKIAEEWKRESEAKLPSFTATEKEAEKIFHNKMEEFDAPVKLKLMELRAKFNDDEFITFVVTLSSEKITSWKLMEWKSSYYPIKRENYKLVVNGVEITLIINTFVSYLIGTLGLSTNSN